MHRTHTPHRHSPARWRSAQAQHTGTAPTFLVKQRTIATIAMITNAPIPIPMSSVADSFSFELDGPRGGGFWVDCAGSAGGLALPKHRCPTILAASVPPQVHCPVAAPKPWPPMLPCCKHQAPQVWLSMTAGHSGRPVHVSRMLSLPSMTGRHVLFTVHEQLPLPSPGRCGGEGVRRVDWG